jgi:hypothetical protein
MQKRARPHAASVLKGHPDHGGNHKPVGRTAARVIQVQIDNIHLELDTQMHRTAQLETLLVGIKEELHELIDLVKWLQHEVLNKHAPGERAERTVLH